MPAELKETVGQHLGVGEKLINSQSKIEMENFIWANLRIVTEKTVSQRALEDFSKEVKGEASIYVILAKGYVHAIKHSSW